MSRAPPGSDNHDRWKLGAQSVHRPRARGALGRSCGTRARWHRGSTAHCFFLRKRRSTTVDSFSEGLRGTLAVTASPEL